MPVLHEFWDPNEWELHAFGLLQDRHGAVNVMKVPARHKGDFGIDGYCLCDQVVYQSYAVQEPCEVADRATKQQTKITTDIGKFRTRAEVQALFTGTRISRWILVVPLHDSAKVNVHLAKKTAEVRALHLPYVADDFEVLIHDLECFDGQSRDMRASQRRLITLGPRPPTAEQIDSWTQESNPLVSDLSRKLRKRAGLDNLERLNSAVRESVGWFLEKENALADLRQSTPQLHEALSAVISRQTTKLAFYGTARSGAAGQILRSELESLIKEIQQAVPNLSDESAQQIALGSVVEWLLRCPLDFPPYGHAA